MQNESVQDWLRIHRHLLELESAFTDLAIQTASGVLPMKDLEVKRAELQATRDQCTAAYNRAFPSATRAPINK